jgi:uncharacterized protein
MAQACTATVAPNIAIWKGNCFSVALFCHLWHAYALGRGTQFGRARYRSTDTTSPDIAMKLHASSTQQYQTVTGYDENGVEINAQPYNYSLIVMPETPPRAWEVDSFEQLNEAHFAQILADAPDVVILGTGERQRFVHPKLTAALTMRRIGVECMDSQAACRTYNILMGEGRKVTLALILAPAAGKAA